MFVLANILQSVLGGGLLALLLVLIIYVACRALAPDSVRSRGAIMVLLVLLVLLGAQSTMLLGAYFAKDYVDDADDYAASVMETIGSAVDVDGFDIGRQQLAEQAHSALNHYMLRRGLWMTGFVVVGLVALTLMPRRHGYSDTTASDAVIYYDDY